MQDEFRLVNEGGVFPIGVIVFERVRPAQIQTSECHDKPAEPQTMFDPALLLTLPVTTAEHIVSTNIFTAGGEGTSPIE